MKVVTIAAPKGGATKTTTTTLLAVRAVQDKQRVCLIDLNADQANLAQWHVTRGSPKNPHLEEDIERITRDVGVIQKSGAFDWLFIDTPPLDMDVIENAVLVADCVIVPVRASIFDVGAVDAVVEMCKRHKKPFAFLMSAVDTRFKDLNASALNALVNDGPVLGTRISYRLPYINAATNGKTGPEIDKKLQTEVDSLWTEVRTLAGDETLKTSKEKRRRMA
ncbi:AAA family ATPase [Filomicrobium sp.]|uniref:AAA family ATPase n=1 Tax=Filomicrobium sp. TaxID=2024831 RepID=UPI002587DEA1|nr:AAA family ATPase [Filomicrobium sp.]MCV0371744.1 AAA family ATPase [Filomicrobium sp.]